MATLTLTPADGSITLKTAVTGAAARMGHRLVITFDDWTVTADVADGEVRSVAVDIAIDSLRVVSGAGGVTPLSPVDKQLIRRNALKTLHAGEHPRATFASAETERDGDLLQVAGDLQIAGTTKRVAMSFTVHDTTVTGRVPIPQSAFGVKPYSLMMGALQVADEVAVEVHLTSAQ